MAWTMDAATNGVYRSQDTKPYSTHIATLVSRKITCHPRDLANIGN